MSPELAAKIPKQLETVVAQLPNSRLGAAVVTARRVLTRVAWLQRGLFLLGGALLVAGILLHPDRRQALMRAGVGLVVVALLLALVIPAGRLVALLVTQIRWPVAPCSGSGARTSCRSSGSSIPLPAPA